MINWEKWNVIVLGVSSLLGLILGTAGIFIGISSLEFTKKIETARLQPLLDFEITSSDDQSIYLVNLSPAPAYIENFAIRNANGEYVWMENWDHSSMIELIGFDNYESEFDAESNIYLSWIDAGSYIGPNERYVLFRERGFNAKSDQSKAAFRSIFLELRASRKYMVEYCDVLKENCRVEYLGQ